MPSLLPKTKPLLILAKKIAEKQKLKFYFVSLFQMETRDYLKYFVNNCLWKQIFASNLPQTPSNLILF